MLAENEMPRYVPTQNRPTVTPRNFKRWSRGSPIAAKFNTKTLNHNSAQLDVRATANPISITTFAQNVIKANCLFA